MPTAEQNSIPRSTADKLVAAHDGDVALLYIWLDLNGGFDADRAARELCRTEAEIKNAHEKLLRMGLSRPAARPEQEIKLPPAEELPEYTSADIVRRSKEDSGFQAVIAQAQHKLGRVLSTAELKTLFWHLRLPRAAGRCYFHAHRLLHRRFHRKIRSRPAALDAQHRKGSLLMGKQGDHHHRAADEYYATPREALARRRAEDLNGAWRRVLTPTERKYMTSWFDMGFDNEAILIAYDRTVTNTGALKWGYMNKDHALVA